MQIVVVMPYISHCTLLNFLREQRKGAGIWCFPENMAWSIFRQVISGVGYLHDNLTIHHNLTLQSILFDCKQNRVVITGFRVAEIAAPKTGGATLDNWVLRQKHFTRPKFVNPYFTAPELLQSSDTSKAPGFESVYTEGKADIYSCGVILVSPIP